MIALFNENKNFIGYSNVVPPTINLYKDLGDLDINKHFWDGDFDNGELKEIQSKKIDEFDLESQFLHKIKCLYSNELSLLLCIKQINLIANKLDCFDENFKNMYDDISPIVDFYDKAINSLKETDKLESKEELYEKHKNLFKPD